jgi:hypothetical protein
MALVMVRVAHRGGGGGVMKRKVLPVPVWAL